MPQRVMVDLIDQKIILKNNKNMDWNKKNKITLTLKNIRIQKIN